MSDNVRPPFFEYVHLEPVGKYFIFTFYLGPLGVVGRIACDREQLTRINALCAFFLDGNPDTTLQPARRQE